MQIQLMKDQVLEVVIRRRTRAVNIGRKQIPLHPSWNYVIFTQIYRLDLTLSETVCPQARQLHKLK